MSQMQNALLNVPVFLKDLAKREILPPSTCCRIVDFQGPETINLRSKFNFLVTKLTFSSNKSHLPGIRDEIKAARGSKSLPSSLDWCLKPFGNTRSPQMSCPWFSQSFQSCCRFERFSACHVFPFSTSAQARQHQTTFSACCFSTWTSTERQVRAKF